MNPIIAHDTRMHLYDFGEAIAFRDDSAGVVVSTGADGEPLQAVVDRDPDRLQEGDGKASWADEFEVLIARSDLPDVASIDAVGSRTGSVDAVQIDGVWRPVARVLEPDDPGTWRLAVGR